LSNDLVFICSVSFYVFACHSISGCIIDVNEYDQLSIIMLLYHKFAIVGIVLGLLMIIIGNIALLTPEWIKINHEQSSHTVIIGFAQKCDINRTHCYESSMRNESTCTKTQSYQYPQYMEMTGFTIVVVGLLTSALCTAFINQRDLHFIPLAILFIGVILMHIGIIFHMKLNMNIVEQQFILEFQIGYSMILMIVADVLSILILAYFSYTTGYIYYNILHLSSIFS
jgi:hypothetical protein